MKKKGEDSEEEESFWNAFNLVPDEKRYGEKLGREYTCKMICEYVAKSGMHGTFRELYEETPLATVWEYLAMIKAINY